MSTQNKTQSNTSFNPLAMSQYTGLQGQIGSNWNQAMSNPMQASFGQQQINMANQQNQMNGQANINSWMNNMNVNGSGGVMNPFQLSMLNNAARQTSAANSNSFNSILNNVNQFRFGATQSAMGYRPLQTGGTQINRVTGVGTWLPQVAQGAIQGAGALNNYFNQQNNSGFNYWAANNANPFTPQAGNTDMGNAPNFGSGAPMDASSFYSNPDSNSFDMGAMSDNDAQSNPFMPSF